MRSLMTFKTRRIALATLLIGALSGTGLLLAAEQPADSTATASNASAKPVSEIEQLKHLLLDQQRQINELRQELAQHAAEVSAEAIRGAANSETVVAATPQFPSTGQVRRSWRVLCGIKGCTCGNIMGMRGPQTVRVARQEYNHALCELIPAFAND